MGRRSYHINKCDRLPKVVAFFYALQLRSQFGQKLEQDSGWHPRDHSASAVELQTSHIRTSPGSPKFSTIRPKPLKRVRILYSLNSDKTTTAIRPVTREATIAIRPASSFEIRNSHFTRLSRIFNNSANTPEKGRNSLQSQFGVDHNSVGG